MPVEGVVEVVLCNDACVLKKVVCAMLTEVEAEGKNCPVRGSNIPMFGFEFEVTMLEVTVEVCCVVLMPIMLFMYSLAEGESS